MKDNAVTDFSWRELTDRIHMGNVIPVIGEGLYWVINPEDGNEVLLYPYLAKKFVQEMGLEPPEQEETFHQAVFRYLEKKNDDYFTISHFLQKALKKLSPVPKGPLWKLACIKPLSLFINTTYDSFMEQILKNVRTYSIEAVNYTFNDKGSMAIEPALFKMLKKREISLIFNIYGSSTRSVTPAYTEKDILETVVTLQKDMEVDRENKFFQTLEVSSLLFTGCRYDDWLFRFFIRTTTNKPFTKQNSPQSKRFIGDDFTSFNCGSLLRFLKAYAAEVYYADCNREFVDRLFLEMEQHYPENIISPSEFPQLAFISFHGDDREAAMKLASQLRHDGLNVWLDERQLTPGEVVDDDILKAISRCPIFIPIVSKTAKQFQPEEGRVKYHIREWEWAYSKYTQGQNPRRIIPVVIDDTDWMYEYFKKFAYLKTAPGRQIQDYEKLRNILQDILHHPQRVGQRVQV